MNYVWAMKKLLLLVATSAPAYLCRFKKQSGAL
jgi:hypothetical protein